MRLHWRTLDERERDLGIWHFWFAWHPVRIFYRDWRWLEVVARRGEWIGIGNHWTWFYKATK